MYFHQSRNVEQMNLSFRPTVVELRAYLAHYGVTVPSRLRKDDLVALADDVRYSDVEVVVHMVDKLGGTIAPVVVPCGNCGDPVVPDYDYCASCMRSMAAADDAWRAHMNPPVEVVEVETVTVVLPGATHQMLSESGWHQDCPRGWDAVEAGTVTRVDKGFRVTATLDAVDAVDLYLFLESVVEVVASMTREERGSSQGPRARAARAGMDAVLRAGINPTPVEVDEVVWVKCEYCGRNVDSATVAPDRLPVCDRSVCQQLAQPQSTPVPCEYFALCPNLAVGTTSHPVLGAVPTCQSCADRFDLDVRPF